MMRTQEIVDILLARDWQRAGSPVVVPLQSAGASLGRSRPQSVVPELPHAEVHFNAVSLRDSQLLPEVTAAGWHRARFLAAKDPQVLRQVKDWLHPASECHQRMDEEMAAINAAVLRRRSNECIL